MGGGGVLMFFGSQKNLTGKGGGALARNFLPPPPLNALLAVAIFNWIECWDIHCTVTGFYVLRHFIGHFAVF